MFVLRLRRNGSTLEAADTKFDKACSSDRNIFPNCCKSTSMKRLMPVHMQRPNNTYLVFVQCNYVANSATQKHCLKLMKFSRTIFRKQHVDVM